MSQKIYAIHGMDCADCARTIEKGVSQLAGVQSVEVDFATEIAPAGGSRAVIRQQVEALNIAWETSPTPPPPLFIPISSSPSGAICWAQRDPAGRAGEWRLSVCAVGLWLRVPTLIVEGVLIAAMLVAGYPIARSGLNALLINRDFNINLLMTIAAIGAMLIGELWEAATVILLFAVAEALEGFTVDQARDSLRGLMELAPATAVRLRGGREENVPVETLRSVFNFGAAR
jgi:Cd2+/Zn2+-exporting ATPase